MKMKLIKHTSIKKLIVVAHYLCMLKLFIFQFVFFDVMLSRV